jgi:hypothetical protein
LTTDADGVRRQGTGPFISIRLLSPVAVRPLARLRVEPADFPFIDDVVQHTLDEPVGRAVVRATLLRALRG